MSKTFQQALHLVRQGIGNDVRNALVLKAPVDEGMLKGSISYNIEDKNINLTMMLYALYVEFGTGGQRKSQTSTVDGKTVTVSAKPNRKMPMKKVGEEWISLVEKWAERHLGKGSGFALAKHIQLYGTAPFPFIRPVLYTDIRQILIENWNRHMVDIELQSIGGS